MAITENIQGVMGGLRSAALKQLPNGKLFAEATAQEISLGELGRITDVRVETTRVRGYNFNARISYTVENDSGSRRYLIKPNYDDTGLHVAATGTDRNGQTIREVFVIGNAKLPAEEDMAVEPYVSTQSRGSRRISGKELEDRQSEVMGHLATISGNLNR